MNYHHHFVPVLECFGWSLLEKVTILPRPLSGQSVEHLLVYLLSWYVAPVQSATCQSNKGRAHRSIRHVSADPETPVSEDTVWEKPKEDWLTRPL